MVEPIPFERVHEYVRERGRLADPPDVALVQRHYVPGFEPKFEQRGLGIARDAVSGEEGIKVFWVDVEVARRRLGAHAFPPGVEGTELPVDRDVLPEEDHADALTGFLPDHLALRPFPGRLDPRLRVAQRFSDVVGDDLRWATTVFAPDDRYTFSDTSFPWCTSGRVDTAGGSASGVMVGPRHLLTCSHAIQWIAEPDPHVAGWVQFRPSYFDASAPFGEAWGAHIYWQQQVTPPTIDGTEDEFDYVVVVLDRRMGDLTGWMGSRTYDDGWDGGNYWSHIGYPGDLASFSRPSFQGNFSLNGDDTQPAEHQAMYHTGDVWPGQSGGPMFGWWEAEPWPRVVAVQSWQNSSTNGASGGSNLVDLIIRARSDFP